MCFFTKIYVPTNNVVVMNKKIKTIQSPSSINGLIPGVIGNRAFPTNNFTNSDPFLMLDHIGPQVVGKDWKLNGDGHDHPHRGFETLTFMFEGKMNHRDSMGNRAELNSGSVQRMNAGSGIIHGGDMEADVNTGRFHEMQLWVNLPQSKKMSTPEIHNATVDNIPSIKKDAMELRVISGVLNGVDSLINTTTETQVGHLIAKGKGEMTIDSFKKSSNVMLYVLEGTATVSGTTLEAFQLGVMSQEGSEIEISTEGNAQLLLLAGTPLNEPIAFGGPFVMNSKEEIQQAQRDFQEGKFGKIS